MGKSMVCAVALLAVFFAIGGVGGLLLFAVLAVPIGIVIGLIALAAGWFNK